MMCVHIYDDEEEEEDITRFNYAKYTSSLFVVR